jgi:hypothetical protein
MKRFTMKSLVVAAALAAAAVSASAQSLNAEIPFSFKAGDAVLTAGSYRINVGNTLVRLTNMDTKKSAMVTSRYRTDVKYSAAGDAKLWFECTGSNCVLSKLWNGVGNSAVVVGAPAKAGKEVAEIRVVSLTAAKAE